MRFKILSILLLATTSCFSQHLDSLLNNNRPFSLKNIAIPSSFIIIGVTQVGHESKELQVDLQEDFPYFRSHLDDIVQYIPATLSLFSGQLGLKPQHSFKSRLILSAISYGAMGITVNILKRTIQEERPDGSGNNSFPSGHAAFAFTGAELFHQELKNSHPILSYAAFPLAIGVSTYRLLNNKHYLSDVLVGAGIGMLSAKLAYAIYRPKIQNSNKFSFSLSPTQVLGKNGFTFLGNF